MAAPAKRVPLPDFSAEEEFPTLSNAPKPQPPAASTGVASATDMDASDEEGRLAATSAAESDSRSLAVRRRARSAAAAGPVQWRSNKPRKSKMVPLADLFAKLDLDHASGRGPQTVANSRQRNPKPVTVRSALNSLGTHFRRMLKHPEDPSLRTVSASCPWMKAVESFARPRQLLLQSGFRREGIDSSTVYTHFGELDAVRSALQAVKAQLQRREQVSGFDADLLPHGRRGKERRAPRPPKPSRLKRLVAETRGERRRNVLTNLRATLMSCAMDQPLPPFVLFDITCAAREGILRPPQPLPRRATAGDVLTIIENEINALKTKSSATSSAPFPIPESGAEDADGGHTTAESGSGGDDDRRMRRPILCVTDTETETMPHQEIDADTQTWGNRQRCDVGVTCRPPQGRDKAVGNEVPICRGGMLLRRPPPVVVERGTSPIPGKLCNAEVQCTMEELQSKDGSVANRPPLDAAVPSTSTSDAASQTAMPLLLSIDCQTESSILRKVYESFGVHALWEFLDHRTASVALPLDHRPRIRAYCTAVLRDDIDATVSTMLELLAKYQRRTLKDANHKTRRRYVVGLRQAVKSLLARRSKMVLLAPNVEKVELDGGLDGLIQRLLGLARAQGVPVVFCLQRRKLGRPLGITRGVSAVSVYSADGAYAEYKRLCSLAESAAAEYPRVVANRDRLVQERVLADRCAAVAREAAAVAAREKAAEAAAARRREREVAVERSKAERQARAAAQPKPTPTQKPHPKETAVKKVPLREPRPSTLGPQTPDTPIPPAHRRPVHHSPPAPWVPASGLPFPLPPKSLPLSRHPVYFSPTAAASPQPLNPNAASWRPLNPRAASWQPPGPPPAT